MAQIFAPETIQERVKREITKGKVTKLFATAEKYGIVHRGFTGIDYLGYAIQHHGWESNAIGGPKGQGKSNLLLQRGLGVFKEFDEVLNHVVTRRKGFLSLLKDAIDRDERIPWVGIDDIGVIFPSSIYYSDRKIFASMQSSWEVLRTVINCLDWTCTRKNKVASFILEDITGDLICYKRIGEIKSHYNYVRWLWLRNFKDPRKMVSKMIMVEDIPFPLIPDALRIDTELMGGNFIVGGETYHGERFFKEKALLMGIERPDFRKYWNIRLGLTKTAFSQFSKLIEEQVSPTPKGPKRVFVSAAVPATSLPKANADPSVVPTMKDAEAMEALAKQKEKTGM